MKITLIGAGSVVFAKNLIGDILQFPELSDATISLMDIDPARVKVAEIMARKMIAKLGVRAKVEATLDQRRAIRGANYVICTVQVGGYKPATVIDFEIPKKYGLQQTIADTLGVGGVFRGLRTIPVINRIAEDMAAVGAPGCLLLNYTNPMAMNCWAVDRAVGIPHVGLCHSVQGTSQQLATFAGLSYEDVSYLVAGINHMAFFLKFEYKKQDAYPLLFRLLDDPAFTQEKVRFEMMRRTGYFVTESSEHQSEYVPYFIHHGKKMIERFGIPIDEYLRRCESGLANWEATEAELLGRDGDIHVGPQTHEYGSYIIHSRETGRPRVIYGNVPNRGLITNLPEGCCVEVPCLVDNQGVQPTHIGALPPQLAAMCQTNINVQALTVEAALTKKREHIYHAVMLDPHAASTLPLDKIWAMCDDLIEAHQKEGLMGDYAPVIRSTGRAHAGTGDRILALAEAGEIRGGKMEVRVSVVNPRTAAVQVPLRLTVRKWKAAGAAKGTALSVRVGAQASVVKTAEISLPGPAEEGFEIGLESGLEGVFTKSLSVRPRRLLKSKAGVMEFNLALAGVPAAKGLLRRSGENLVLQMQVEDSKITPKPQPWQGSSVELFFAANGSNRLGQFFLVPARNGSVPKLLDHGFKGVKGFRGRQRKISAGYEITATVPAKALGLGPTPKSFLFDCYANVTALGDAHSGGHASLSGRFDSHVTNGNYAQVVLE
jgi:alpha-galactosidase/6-phospho-beta-glucosidase family protein